MRHALPSIAFDDPSRSKPIQAAKRQKTKEEATTRQATTGHPPHAISRGGGSRSNHRHQKHHTEEEAVAPPHPLLATQDNAPQQNNRTERTLILLLLLLSIYRLSLPLACSASIECEHQSRSRSPISTLYQRRKDSSRGRLACTSILKTGAVGNFQFLAGKRGRLSLKRCKGKGDPGTVVIRGLN